MTVSSIQQYKKEQRAYDLAKMNRQSIQERVVDAEIVDIKLIDKDDSIERWIVYNFTTPDGEQYEHDLKSDIERSIGEIDQMLLVTDDDGDFCDIELLKPLPPAPSIDTLISNVTMLATMWIVFAAIGFLDK
jgi:hypothetical protein